MNKQELIEKIEAMPNNTSFIRPKIDKKVVLGLVRQLDEPQKVTIPQFVADWYEEHKDNLEFNIFDYVYRFDQNAGFDFKDWFDDFNTKPIQTLVNMHQFGYEVEVELEKEKRYYVRFKGDDENYSYLIFIYHLHAWVIGAIKQDKKIRSTHTRKELEEAGYGEVFNSPLFEVVEVEE